MEVWFLMGTALVFFMQAGFCMVESGFTRAKNTGNIIMKNLMDFCLGTVVFIIIGAPLLLASEAVLGGLLGSPSWEMLTDPSNYDWANFVFNLVFCATTATIVSGAMAERTNFKAYCIYSLVLSAIIYPIEAFWVWGAASNGSWLQNFAITILGEDGVFIDFAGSACIHMVGGITALIGAYFIGPRIGKYEKNEDGTITVKAIPGHNILIGALGVFILWFGWYGFNGAAASDASELGLIFATTTVAAAFATVSTMIFTWVKNGKPDVSMCLNGSLAGLVAITASCHTVDLIGAAVIGLVAGVLVVIVVEFIDFKLHIDDPVGAVAVHAANGIWGTIACGLFSTSTGLFYVWSFNQLIVQIVGIIAILAWTIGTSTLLFYCLSKIKKKDNTSFLRASKDEEEEGLDSAEHGLTSAYPDFMPLSSVALESSSLSSDLEVEDLAVEDVLKSTTKITKVSIIARENQFDELKKALASIGVTGLTITQVMGCGSQTFGKQKYRGVDIEINLKPKIKVEIVICKVPVETVVNTARKVLYTGENGDGKIFVYDVENVIRVRTGDVGYAALQDD